MRVISLSIWGTDPAFIRGATENIHLAKLYYPGWQVRIYCREDVPEDSRAAFVKAGADVHVIRKERGAWDGLFWRFYPIWDYTVTHTISRDCDSRVNPREAAAVREWLVSGQLFHTMHDHYQHITPILGGMFGCLHWPEMRTLLDQWTKFDAKGDDQLWLEDKVWPLVKGKTVAHDRYPIPTTLDVEDTKFVYDSVRFFQSGPPRPFPPHEPLDKRLHGPFVGSRIL